MIEEAVGTILVGVFINVLLFGFELGQIYRYVSYPRAIPEERALTVDFQFSLFPTDRIGIRALVIFMFLVDCTATANHCAMIYLYTIK